MPKKFSITVPEPIYEALTILARLRDKTTAAFTAETVEAVAQEAIDAGVIEDFKKLQGVKDFKRLALGFTLVDELLTKCADGEMPTDTEIAKAATHTTISVDELRLMCDRMLRENGHAAAK